MQHLYLHACVHRHFQSMCSLDSLTPVLHPQNFMTNVANLNLDKQPHQAACQLSTTRISCLTNIECFAPPHPLSLAAQRRFSKVRISISFCTFSHACAWVNRFFSPSRDAAALGGCWRTRAPCRSTLAIILWPIWARPLRLWPGQASQRRKRTSNGQEKRHLCTSNVFLSSQIFF